MEFEILQDLVLIFGVSAVLVFALERLNIPSIVGFLIAGVILGPHGFGIIKDMHEIEIFAEIGVILLLFTIGIEFSMHRLLRMKKIVLAGGGSYILFAIGVTAAVFYLMIEQLNESIFFGFLIALSSTAIVMKMLAEKGESDSPHGRVMIGVLIFQDLCVVPLMLLTPALSGEGINVIDVILPITKAGVIVAAVLLSARWIVPGLLHQVVHTKSRELFVIAIILLCIGTALLTSKMGLSLALGAFIAGLIISESEYAHQATSDILPFKDSFIGLFFVSVGMLMNIGYMSDHCLKIGIAVSLIFILKAVIGVVSSLLIKTPLRTSIHAGIGLAQVGEFSFVLAVAGRSAGIITEEFYQIFLSSSVVTMMMTPFMMMIAPVVSRSVTSSRLLKRLVKIQRVSEGGDGTSKEILNKLSIQNARLLVVAISDPASTRRIVSIARRENPDLYIIVRTRYLAEVDDLRALGADEVIPEEFETAVEIFSRALNKYNFPSNVILDMVDKVREDSYTALRSVELQKKHLFEKCEWLPNIEIDGYRIPDGSHLGDKGIAELRVREKTGITIIAVRRGAEVFTNPSPEFHFRYGDIILFTGERKKMMQALEFFRGN
jgi:CPA2 family monovalent cation:H+ antiporter-2